MTTTLTAVLDATDGIGPLPPSTIGSRRPDYRLPFGPHQPPGIFIVVEGLDGCGKTTLVRRMLRYLGARGVRAERTRFPSTDVRRSETFRLFVRQRREDRVDALQFELLYMADRIHHTRAFIRPRLREGAVVVSDRYALCSVGELVSRSDPLWDEVTRAVATDGWFKTLCGQLLQPDLYIWMYAEVDAAIERIRRRARERDLPFNRERFHALLEAGRAIAEANGMLFVDSTHRSPRQCLEAIRPDLDRVIAHVPHGAVGGRCAGPGERAARGRSTK